MQYWLIKTEPDTYSWEDLVRDRRTEWTGVRNYQARNNLRKMQNGDLLFVYHSGSDKAIQGIVKIYRTARPDSTAEDEDWSSIEIEYVETFNTPVTLEEIKKKSELKHMVLVRNSRLSVQPVKETEWNICVDMGK